MSDHICGDCGHPHNPNGYGCIGAPTASDRWAGVSPIACDCNDEPEWEDGVFGDPLIHALLAAPHLSTDRRRPLCDDHVESSAEGVRDE